MMDLFYAGRDYSQGSLTTSVEALTHIPLDKMAAILADDIFANEKFYILIKVSLKFVRKFPIDGNPALV